MLMLFMRLSFCLFFLLPAGQIFAVEQRAREAPDERGAFAFILDNDLFVGTDQKYTNGVRFSLLTRPAEGLSPDRPGSRYATALKQVLQPLPVVGSENMRHSATFAFTQFMVTPNDIRATRLLPDQAPYMGYLELGTSLLAWNDDEFHEFAFAIGVVGPDSSAGRTQRFVHRVVGADKPMGWANQVANRYTANLSYNAGYRVLRHDNRTGIKWDATFSYGLTLGSPNTYASAGTLFRWGRNLPQNFNVYFANGGGESALLRTFEKGNALSWFLYAGLVGNATAYSYIESATEQTHSFNYETISGSLIVGASVGTNKFQLGVSLQADTSPVKGDTKAISYGSIYFSVPF